MPTLAAALAGGVRALRSTAHLSKDRSAPNVSVDHAQAERDQDAHESHYLDLGMDRWLPYVADLSFDTAAVPLSMADAKLLRACYAHLHGRTYYEDMSLPTSDSLPPSLVAALTELGARLWPSMKALGADEGGVFAKLSGRSAKDAPLFTARLDEAVATQLATKHGDDETGAAATTNVAAADNTRLLALFDASLSLMRLREPASLLWTLVNSQRVDEDLDVALRHPQRWDQAVVVRRWSDAVSSDLEFRMFVNNGVPTGLTQYNQLVCSSRIARRSAAIAAALCDYFTSAVLPRLAGTTFYSSVGGRFTCDFALHPRALALLDEAPPAALTREHIELVELNCFYEATGMGLFDYHKDKAQLDDGPFECRVLTEPPPRAAVKLEVEWREVLKTLDASSATGMPVRGAAAARRRSTDAAWRQLLDAQSV